MHFCCIFFIFACISTISYANETGSNEIKYDSVNLRQEDIDTCTLYIQFNYNACCFWEQSRVDEYFGSGFDVNEFLDISGFIKCYEG